MDIVCIKKENLKKLGYQDFEDWNKDENHVYIGRNMHFYVPGTFASKWQNPFTSKKQGLENALKFYKQWIITGINPVSGKKRILKTNGEIDIVSRQKLRKGEKIIPLINEIEELKGKVLGCWCKPEPCHGDILIDLLKRAEKGEIKIEKTYEDWYRQGYTDGYNFKKKISEEEGYLEGYEEGKIEKEEEKINWKQIPNAILFYGHSKGKPYNEFSNFYSDGNIIIDGKSYPTVEHYFQSQKFAKTDPEYAEQVRLAKTHVETKKLGNSRDHPIADNWNEIAYQIMVRGVFAKFSQSPILKKVLLDTGDKIIVENAPGDFIWGCGRDGTGENKLGLALMEVRDKLKGKFDYISKLSDNIYFGSYPSKETLQELSDLGVKLIVDLTDDNDIKIIKEQNREAPYQTIIKRFHHPITDKKTLKNEEMKELIKYLAIEAKKYPIYIHCRGGHGRSALVAGLIYGYINNLLPKQVFDDLEIAHQKRKVMSEKMRKLGVPQTDVQKNQLKNLLQNEDQEIELIPVIYDGTSKTDFAKMIKKDKQALFIFNDNEEGFPESCSAGKGNAIIRPYRCKNPIQAVGIPTGSLKGDGYQKLDKNSKEYIDQGIKILKNLIETGNYNKVYYSANKNGELGTGIFNVNKKVKDYILEQIQKLFSKSKDQRMVLMMGFPACGKSYYVKKNFPNYFVASRDLQKEKFKKLAKEALQNGDNVVIDNMNFSVKARKEVIDIAKSLNIPVDLIWIKIDEDIDNAIKECQKRNEKRDDDKKVGNNIFYIQKNKLEKPNKKEGIRNIKLIYQNKMLKFDNNNEKNILSTKYPIKVTINGNEYENIQQYFNKMVKNDPNLDKIKIMAKAQAAKFMQHSNLRKYLFNIKSPIIDTAKSEFWKDNEMGKMINCTRESLKDKNILTIASWNVNGIRSRIVDNELAKSCKIDKTKVIEPDSNLAELLEKANPSIICFQETKCDSGFEGCFKNDIFPYTYWNCSTDTARGRTNNTYSGTSIWSKIKPKKVEYDLPTLENKNIHGRIIIAYFTSFILINTYVPNSGTNEEYRINIWNPAIEKYLKQLRNKNKNVIWTGDLNVAPEPKDVYFGYEDSDYYLPKRMTGKDREAGFLPEERESFQKIIELGYVDVYRVLHKNIEHVYTYWLQKIKENRFRKHNKGWRIDHFLVNQDLMKNIFSCNIYPKIGTKTLPQGSDHAPITLTINLDNLKGKMKKLGAGIIVVKKIEKEWRVLALRLGKGYDLPKGEIDAGENTFEAAVRETDEEADITELNFKWGKQVFHADHVTLYLAETNQKGKIKKNPETKEYEHWGLFWVSWDQMLENIYSYLRPSIEWAKKIVQDNKYQMNSDKENIENALKRAPKGTGYIPPHLRKKDDKEFKKKFEEETKKLREKVKEIEEETKPVPCAQCGSLLNRGTYGSIFEDKENKNRIIKGSLKKINKNCPKEFTHELKIHKIIYKIYESTNFELLKVTKPSDEMMIENNRCYYSQEKIFPIGDELILLYPGYDTHNIVSLIGNWREWGYKQIKDNLYKDYHINPDMFYKEMRKLYDLFSKNNINPIDIEFILGKNKEGNNKIFITDFDKVEEGFYVISKENIGISDPNLPLLHETNFWRKK